MTRITVDYIREARAQMEGSVVKTPCAKSVTLSKITGAEVYLEFTNLQFTGSFKDRGALIKLLQLDQEQRRRGVIANSARPDRARLVPPVACSCRLPRSNRSRADTLSFVFVALLTAVPVNMLALKKARLRTSKARG